MRCTNCGIEGTRATDTRQRPDGTVYRRRVCDECGARFTTTELPEDELHDLRELRRAVERLQTRP